MRSARRSSAGGAGGRIGWDVRPNPIVPPPTVTSRNRAGRDSGRNPRLPSSIGLRRSASLERERYGDLRIPAVSDVSGRRLVREVRSPPPPSGEYVREAYYPAEVGRLPARGFEELPRHHMVPVNGSAMGELNLPLNSSFISDDGYGRKLLLREPPPSSVGQDPRYHGYAEQMVPRISAGEGSIYPLSSSGLPRDELGRSDTYRGFRPEPEPVRYSLRDGLDASDREFLLPGRNEPRGHAVNYSPPRRGDEVMYSEVLYPQGRRAVDEIGGGPRNYRHEERGPISGYPGGEHPSFRGANLPLGEEVLPFRDDFRRDREGIAGYQGPGRGAPRRNLIPQELMGVSVGNGGVNLGRDRVTRDNVAGLRKTRNARAFEMPPFERPAKFAHNKLSGLKRRFPDSGEASGVDLKKRPRPSSPGRFPANRGPLRQHDAEYAGKKRTTLTRGKAIEESTELKAPDGKDQPKIDPPMDSEEYKQQVHEAFLHFLKVLYEDPNQRKKFLTGGEAPQSFKCFICDRKSKEFGDVHRLVMHAFTTHKTGPRTEHRGLHKALCVLMGWDWTIAPETSKRYTMKPAPEADALKSDLIVWPPVVIIRDLSIIRKPVGRKKQKIPAVQAALKGMIELPKVTISRGNPGERGTVIVKFVPSLSGLRDADKLHKLLLQRKKGKTELEAAVTTKDAAAGEELVEASESLYGYIATVEDLDMLNAETKKKCAIKSKKEIEDIVDAPIEVIKS